MTDLRTERLVLRQWRDEDREPWAALNADPAVMAHFPRTLARAEADDFVDRHAALIAERGWGLWAVEVVGGAPFIGFTGLAVPGFTVPGYEDGCVEVGWRLAQEHWGRGYAPEAGRAALAHGFDAVGLEEIVSFTSLPNTSSRRVMEKLDMTEAFEFDHPNLAGHPLERHVLYRSTRSGVSSGRGR